MEKVKAIMKFLSIKKIFSARELRGLYKVYSGALLALI